MSSSRDKSFNPTTSLFSFFTGGAANLAATMATLPLATITAKSQVQGNVSTLPTLFRETFTASGLKQVYSASGLVLRTAPLQSGAYLGVAHAVRQHYGDSLSPAKVGLIAGLSSASAESLVAAWAQPRIIAKWTDGPAKTPFSWKDFASVYKACLAKNSVANTLTLSSVFSIQKWLSESTNLSVSSQSFVAGIVSGVGVNLFFIPPLVVLETRMSKKPQPIMAHLREVEKLSELWRGAIPRAIQKGSAAGIAFGCISFLSQFTQRQPVADASTNTDSGMSPAWKKKK